MEKRAILAIALSILVLFGFRYLEEKRTGGAARRTPPPARSTAPSGGSGAAAGQPPSGAAAASQPPTPAEAPAPAAAGPSETRASPRQVVVDGPLYRAVVDNRGGVLSSWVLKKYKSTRGEPFEMMAVAAGDPARPYPG